MSEQLGTCDVDPARLHPWTPQCAYWAPKDGTSPADEAEAVEGHLLARLAVLEVVAGAARAEVLAQGYRSSDMARALQALDGEFWFENYVPPLVPSSKQVCGYAITVELDDGPLTQRCSQPPHGAEVEHHYGKIPQDQPDV